MRPLLVLLAVLGVACGERGGRVYPADVVEHFMRGCTANASRATCGCALAALERRFTLDEFRAFEARMARREVPKDVVDAVASCR
jgi:hypothetical protein